MNGQHPNAHQSYVPNPQHFIPYFGNEASYNNQNSYGSQNHVPNPQHSYVRQNGVPNPQHLIPYYGNEASYNNQNSHGSQNHVPNPQHSYVQQNGVQASVGFQAASGPSVAHNLISGVSHSFARRVVHELLFASLSIGLGIDIPSFEISES